MDFRILGPVTVADGDHTVDVGGGRAKAVLVALLTHAGRTVPRSRLIELAWGEAPNSAESNLRTYVSRLRKALVPHGHTQSRLHSDSVGHRVEVHDGELDLQRFEAWTAQAQERAASGEHDLAASDFATGLTQWSGDAFDGAIVEPQLAAARAELEERRDQARLRRIDSQLRCGDHTEALAPLRALVVAEPTRQEIVGMLMLALYRCDRHDEALALYRDTRRRLVEEFGVEPGPELAQLQHRILNFNVELDAPAKHQKSSAPTPTLAPAQLPSDPPAFTGRQAELDLICSRARSIPFTVLDGMAGVGKTALAIRAANLLSESFPDGQLYVDLHGYTENVAPAEPGDVLQRLLRALGISSDDIPHQLDDRSALWRSVLRRRRVLAVLDNCANVAQLSALLPGSGQSHVIATSRRKLVELDVDRTVALEVLDPHESAALFRAAAGDTVGTDAHSTRLIDTIVDGCGHLPLAIRLAAGRFRSRRGWTLERLRQRLFAEDRLLDELALGDRRITTVLALSYQDLSESAAKRFCLLALHPGADFDVHAVAALINGTLCEAEDLLESLLDANLLVETAAGRYRMHDLIRAYATRRGQTANSQSEQDLASRRLLDLYRRTGTLAAASLGGQVAAGQPDAEAAAAGPDVAEAAAAARWFDAEHPALLEAVRMAESLQLDSHAVEVALACWTYANRYDRYLEQLAMFEAADAAAQRLDDPAQAADLCLLHGTALNYVGRAGEALAKMESACRLFRRCEDLRGEAMTLSNIAMAKQSLGLYEAAIADSRQAAASARQAGDEFVKCSAIINASASYRHMGRGAECARLLNEVLEVAGDTGNGLLRAVALINLGHIRHELADHEAALQCQREAAKYFDSKNEPYGSLEAKCGLVGSLRALGRLDAALEQSAQVLTALHAVADPQLRANALLEAGRTHSAAGRGRRALDLLEQAQTIADDIAARELRGRVDLAVAEALEAVGDREQARVRLAQARDHFESLGMPKAHALREQLAAS